MKSKLALILVAAAMLTGCSVVEQIDRSVNYTSEAAAYVEQAEAFARELHELAKQAVNDPAMHDKLVAELESMKTRIVEFNALEAPQIAADVHAKIQDYNAMLDREIDQALNALMNDIPAVQAIQDSQIVQTLTDITRLIEQINNLGG